MIRQRKKEESEDGYFARDVVKWYGEWRTPSEE